ncbi:MAG: adenylyltransferase/cytidyltransferase family protein [Bdellovibrionales bacterium]|jgi:cytidyltransferase-like protein|nr:adenylyltransferase/cytidyltransferase family protein [Bdellovibrionales bacterium]MBT3524965.1 adenylyltransferase/cytidyltransferase family protein [Bdellovibrionales bacterium]MBT7670349.1 adenylyltransferase/cytidyltransferase family protein [Bdellovibrionales bacterium]MBT7766679.1 adenylyltransferase/cytidyltransferase family protein [Bdellovibrionales bacterium]
MKTWLLAYLSLTLLLSVAYSSSPSKLEGATLPEGSKKIAFYPGSFDPPHKGHAHIVDTILNEFGFDKVVVAVNTRPPKNYMVSIADRVELVKRQFGKNIDKIEIVIEPPEGKDFLKKTIQQKYQTTVWSAVGSDGWAGIPQKIRDDAANKWIYITRDAGSEALPKVANIHTFKGPVGYSSTKVRKQLLGSHYSNKDLSAATIKYIKDNNLYIANQQTLHINKANFIKEWKHFQYVYNFTDLPPPEFKDFQQPKAWRENFVRHAILKQQIPTNQAQKLWDSSRSFIKHGGISSNANCYKAVRNTMVNFVSE